MQMFAAGVKGRGGGCRGKAGVHYSWVGLLVFPISMGKCWTEYGVWSCSPVVYSCMITVLYSPQQSEIRDVFADI